MVVKILKALNMTEYRLVETDHSQIFITTQEEFIRIYGAPHGERLPTPNYGGNLENIMTWDEEEVEEETESDDGKEDIFSLVCIDSSDADDIIECFKISTYDSNLVGAILVTDYDNIEKIRLLLNLVSSETIDHSVIKYSYILEQNEHDVDHNEIGIYAKDDEYHFEDFVQYSIDKYSLNFEQYNDVIYMWKDNKWYYFKKNEDGSIIYLLKPLIEME